MNQSTSGRPPLTLATNIWYGVGSIAFGMHLTVLTSALLLFYNQVVGSAGGVGRRGNGGNADLRCDLRSVDRGMVGSHALAMGPAPSVHVRLRGSGRDRILLPVRSPARMVAGHLLIYMGVMLMTVRVLLSLYEIPSSALGPELTLDYDQRTSLMSSRFFFGTLGGAAMSILALQVFLRKDATHPLGLLSPAGYRETAVVASIVIFLSIMISCLGTHRFIADLVHEPRVRVHMAREVRRGQRHADQSIVSRADDFGNSRRHFNRPAGRDSTFISRRISLSSRRRKCRILPSPRCSRPLPGLALRRQSRSGSERSMAMIGVFFASLFASVAPIAMRLLVSCRPTAPAHWSRS